MTAPDLPNLGACSPWCALTDVAGFTDGNGNVTVEGANLAVAEMCIQVASDVLFEMSGEQFAGSCSDTVRPQARLLARDHGRGMGGFMGTYGMWDTNGSFFASFRDWPTVNQEEMPDGNLLSSIDLGVFPLTSIIQVLIDGVVLDPSNYRIDNNRHLTRLQVPSQFNSGFISYGWPSSQITDLPSTEVGTFEVSFTYGTPPPPAGLRAAAELAWQMYLSATPSAGACRLPARTTRITRQGVTATLTDPMVLISMHRFGMFFCDAFLETYNPNNLRRRSRVMSPDVRTRVRRTGPAG
jgi:hypothetical protein